MSLVKNLSASDDGGDSISTCHFLSCLDIVNDGDRHLPAAAECTAAHPNDGRWHPSPIVQDARLRSTPSALRTRHREPLTRIDYIIFAIVKYVV